MHRINAFSNFVHRPDSKELEDKNTMFWKLDLFPSSGEGGDTINDQTHCSQKVLFTISTLKHNHSVPGHKNICEQKFTHA
jgi:hypothetical protein